MVEDIVRAGFGEMIRRIQDQWMAQRFSENLGTQNRRLKKPMERIGAMFLLLLPFRVYRCNKIKLDYPCYKVRNEHTIVVYRPGPCAGRE